MRYHYYSVAILLVYVLYKLQYLLRGIVVKRTCRLVAEQDIRVLDDGSANSSSLLLTTRKLIRKLVTMLVKPKGFKQVVNVKRVVAKICAYLDILLDIQVRYKVVHLEDITQVLSSVKGQCLFVHVGCFFAVY